MINSKKTFKSIIYHKIKKIKKKMKILKIMKKVKLKNQKKILMN